MRHQSQFSLNLRASTQKVPVQFLNSNFYTFSDLFIGVSISKRRVSYQQLICQNTKTIVIEFIRILKFVSKQNLRGYCMSSPTQCVRPFSSYSLCFSQINHRYSSFLVNQKVRSFNISVNKPLCVEISHYHCYLCQNQFSKANGEFSQHLQQFVQR